jgi:hypothetical protein
MKHLKMLGLAALAALALTAVLGVGSASAKTCSLAGAGAECGAGHGKVYTGAITAKLATGNAELQSGFINVACPASHLAGKITNGETGTGTIESLTFGPGCKANTGQSCTATTTATAGAPWHAVVVPTAGTTNGTMKVKPVKGTFTCSASGFFPHVTCNYEATEVGAAGEIVINGGAPASVVAAKVPLKKGAGSGASCSETATWSGHYTVSTPTSLYIT